MSRVAFVVLTRLPSEDTAGIDDLAEQLRIDLDANGISMGWIVERVTVLDDSARIASSEKANHELSR